MRKWWKALAALAVVVCVCGWLAWRMGSGRLIEFARETIVREVGQALHEPVALSQLSVSFFPLNVEAVGFSVGAKGEIIRVDRLRLRILPWSSLKQLRLVGEAEISGVLVDIPKLVSESDGEMDDEEEGDERVFPFRVRHLQLTDARVVIPAGDSPFELGTKSIVASGGLSPVSRRFSLRADGDLSVRRAGDQLDVTQIHLVAAEARDGLVVQELTIASGGLNLQGRLDGRDPPVHTVSAQLDLAFASMIDRSLDSLSGAANIAGSLSGSLVDPAVTADVRLEDLTREGRHWGDLDGRFTRQGNELRVTSGRLDGLGGNVGFEAQLTLSDRQPLAFTVDWHDLDVAKIAEVAGEELPLLLAATGSAEGSATLEPFAISGKANGQLTAKESVPVEWSFDGRYAEGAAQVSVQGSQAQLNSLHAEVGLARDESLTGTVRIAFGDVASVARLSGREHDLPFSGNFRAFGTISGSRHAPAVQADVAASNLVVFGEPIGAVQGNLFVDGQRASSRRLAVDFGDGQIELAGTIGFDSNVRNDWNAMIRDVQTDRIVGLVRAVGGIDIPVSKGRISASAKGSGPWTAVDATAVIEGRDFEVAGEPFERLRLDGKTSWPSWQVETTAVHAGDEHLEATIRGRGAEELVEARVDSTWWSLRHLEIGDEAAVSGEVRMNGAVRGKLRSLDGEMELTARKLTWSERRLGDVVVSGRATAGKWQLQSRVLDDTVALTAGLSSQTGQFLIRADWDQASFASLIGDLPGIDVSSSGTLQLAGSLGDVRSFGGELEVPHLLIRRGSLQLEAQRPITARLRNGRVDIESCELAGDGTRLQIGGGLTTGGELHLTGRGSGNLELLEILGEPLRSVGGSFELQVNADRRTAGDVDLTGTVSVEDAVVDVGLPIGVTETNGRFFLEGGSVRVEELAGRLGGGTFTIGGTVDLRSGPDLTWRIADVSGSLVPSLEQELSGQGTLRGAWSELSVAGEIEILRLLYDRNIEPRDFIPSFKRRLAPAEGKPSENVVRLDLHIRAPDDLHIDNNFARVEAMADLRVRGTTERPNLRGRIDVLAGEVFFRDRTFDIVTGVIDFRPQLDLVADLNITAETVVDTPETSYGVTVQISGTTDDPKVVFSADDAGLTQTDVLSLITFGKTVAQLQQGSGGGTSMDALVGFVTGRVTKGVEEEAQSLLRVDRVEIEPAFSSASGAVEPQVRIAKDFGDDFTASLATTLGVDLQRSLNIEYRLTDRTSLLGIWESESEGQAGALGGGIKFRREFRSVPGFSLLGK